MIIVHFFPFRRFARMQVMSYFQKSIVPCRLPEKYITEECRRRCPGRRAGDFSLKDLPKVLIRGKKSA
jgi:hypothetical protein